MLNDIEFGTTTASSNSSTTTPKRRNRRKASQDSDISLLSTASTSTQKVIEKAKQKVQQQKEQRLIRFLEAASDEELISQAQELRCFARSDGGLINDEIRARVWPLLANCIDWKSETSSGSEESSSSSCSDSDFETAVSSFSSSDSENRNNTDEPSIEELRSHPEWNQVEMDVNRTLARFPPGISDDERTTVQGDLIPLIVRVLSENKKFRYYQGFHDICLTLILVLGSEAAFRVSRILSHRTVFKRYLTKSLEESAMHDLQYMYVLLFKHNPKLETYLREAELGTLFALSWPLTWFSHVLNDYKQVVTCFDLFLASDSLMSIYVSAAMVNIRANDIYATEKDMPALHHLLSNIPNSIDISLLLELAQNLFNEYPPKLLRTKLFEEYEKECNDSKKRHARLPPADLIDRYSISKWVVAGTLSAAAFWLFYHSELSKFA
uniref:Rab-GAP TBC domain-containing protein n=1 Tax=Panagrolaimus sp. ES5 TaxID=591445 RepID=A0AC34GWX0_9BILA